MTGWRWHLVRALFLTGILVGSWISLRGSGSEIAAAVGATSLGGLSAALMLTLGGLLITGFVWQQALETLSPASDRTTAWSVFFVGQLGKYIPGSVWSFGAQAVLAARAGIDARSAVTASGLFLGIHVASGLLLAGVVGGPIPLESWTRALLVLVGGFALLPVVPRRIGSLMASATSSWNVRTSLLATTSMCLAWGAYAVSLALLTGSSDPGDLRVLLTAYCVAHAAGVLVPVAPAGLGAREVVFVALLAPTLGTAPATALAILFRLVQTLADLLIAGAAWGVGRHATRHGSGRHCR